MPSDKPKIDTGNAGFDIDGQTYTYDVGVPDAQGGAQGPTDHGNVKVDHSKKDLSKPTKKTLAQYLSDTTMGKRGAATVPNRYPVDAEPTEEIRITDGTGFPVSPKPSNNSTSFDSNVPGSFSDDFPAIQQGLKKGKSSVTGVDGNDLLKKEATGPLVQGYTSSVLKSNRFTSDARMIDADPTDPASSYNPSLINGKALGSSEGGTTISMGRLASIGPTLTMRAGIELGSGDGGFNPNSGPGQAGAILPGVAQLAIRRVDRVMLNAKDVLDSITAAETKNYISPGSLSWGALNNTEDQWSGIAALGMAALSAAMVAGLLLIIEGLSLILGLIKPKPKTPTHDIQGRYSLGSYYGGEKKKDAGGLLGAATALLSLDIGKLLGIQPTHYPFPAALKKGSAAFFGIDDSAGLLGTLGGAVTKALGPDAGYNTIVARGIVRSTLTIIDQIGKIGGNPVNVIKQVLALIEVLRSSKIIAACNIFAQLGDSLLTIPENWTDLDASGATKISEMDADAAGTAVSKNRMRGSLKLAWAGNRAPTQLLLPQNIVATSHLASKLGSFDGGISTLAPFSKTNYKVLSAADVKASGGRISTEDADNFERKLDAEYVPFYLHDIRTNEMIGFHAFLASLTDDFAASYETIDAYGRVEPVKIYKGTVRKISLSFYMVSTSEADFDEMWVKINKLVTLVYPQYTKGKQLADADKYQFTQPFSQLIGASPMIRLRLGDLFRSNYSRFGLARLFGLGNDNFMLDGEKFNSFDAYDSVRTTLEGKIEEALQGGTEKFVAEPGSYPFYQDSGGGLGVSVSLGGESGPENASVFSPGEIEYGQTAFQIKVVKEHPDDPNAVIGEIEIDSELLSFDPDAAASIKSKYDNSDNPRRKLTGGKYVFPKSALNLTQKSKEKLVNDAVKVNATLAQKLGDFLSVESKPNAIAKSFKDTGGKGLAGFIETMNFDWYDKVLWETTQGRTAPKICKVSISFSPIHDISPGLDHLGYNRGPVYPVGPMAPRPEPRKSLEDDHIGYIWSWLNVILGKMLCEITTLRTHLKKLDSLLQGWESPIESCKPF